MRRSNWRPLAASRLTLSRKAKRRASAAGILRADVRAFRRIASRRDPHADWFMLGVSRAADHSVLWLGMSALLASAGGRSGRRAALRGLGSVGITSLVANGILKPILPRRRPGQDLSPFPRLHRDLRSSSMPSGHAASAAAFAAGAALELPIAGIPLVAIAATVAYSRIYNGVHYPSDVLVGATVGAVIGLASKSLWPLIDDAPAVAKTIVPSGSREDLGRGDGSGLTVIVNSASHSGRGQGVDQEILAALPGATIELVEDASMLRERLVAAATSCVVLGIVGGDGSINTAAGVAIEYDIPLLAIPGGTLNHFTRDLGIDSIEEAMAAYRSGDLVAVDIGLFGEHPFLNTASVGIYSEVVRMRERYEARVGKWPSMMMALIVTMRRAVPLELEVDGRRMQVWTVFVGNCAYDPPGFAPATRSALDEGNLDVRIIDGARPYARARLLVALLTGTLLRTSVYERSVRASFTIKTAEPVLVSVDGEVIDDQATEFVVAKEPTRLKVFSAPRD